MICKVIIWQVFSCHIADQMPARICIRKLLRNLLMLNFALWITLPLKTDNYIKSSAMSQFKFKNYVNSRWLKNRFFRLAMGIAAGALVGLIYWKFVGCHSGTCPLTSSPTKTVIIYSIMGGLLTYSKGSDKEKLRGNEK
jgi:hypothetical protein